MLLLIVRVMFCRNVHKIDVPVFQVIIEKVILDAFLELFLLHFKLSQVLNYVRVCPELVSDILNKLLLVGRKFAAVVSYTL